MQTTRNSNGAISSHVFKGKLVANSAEKFKVEDFYKLQAPELDDKIKYKKENNRDR